MKSKFRLELIHIDDIGENERRMWEIGKVMDELVKLGFQNLLGNTFASSGYKIIIRFHPLIVEIEGVETYIYQHQNWQQELLSKVKELLNA